MSDRPVIMITGGGSGIGAATAKLAAASYVTGTIVDVWRQVGQR